MESEVVSVRVAKGIKEQLQREGIDLSYEFNKYVKRRLALIRQKEAIEELIPIIKKMKPSKKGFAVKSVREDRYAGH